MNKIFLLCGVPGCGKSTWAKDRVNEKPQAIIISRDEIRFSLVKENEDYFSKEKQVYKTFIKNIQNAINSGIKEIYIDATHINQISREKLLNNIDIPTSKYQVIACFFDIPKRICKERNALREGRRQVPNHVIDNMYDQLRDPSEDYIKYDEIWYINQDGMVIATEVKK